MPSHAGFRVFVSAVTGELGTYRTEVARALRRKGLDVRDQQHFRQGGGTLIEQLRDYIRDCDAVVLLVGERCGAFPSEEHAASAGQSAALDACRAATGLARASYTQWEYLLARDLGKKIYVFFTAEGFAPDQPNDESPDLRDAQRKYRDWVKHVGQQRDPVTTKARLLEDVLVLPFPDLGRPKPVLLPYPSLGTLFKGRDEFLRQLRQSLQRAGNGHATAIVGRAVHGLGGVGKTRLAVEYAWQHQDDYSAVLFVTADSPANLRANLAELVGPLVLDLPEQDLKEEQARLAAALRWLHDHPRWFLIVDNADSEEAADAVEDLIGRLRGGQVLITSRLARWSAAVESLELDVLLPEHAGQFLLQRTARRRRKLVSDDSDAATLAGELDGLALALEQAGAYIEHRRISLADYLAAWRSHEPAVQGWYDKRIMKYPRSLAVTWQTTIEQLDAGALALLRLLAWLAPEPLPLFVLEGRDADSVWREASQLCRSEVEAGARGSQGEKSADLTAALAMLADFSMLRWDAEASTVTVHRVVQEILRTQLPESSRERWVGTALRLLNKAAPSKPSDVRTWPRWNLLRPHVAVCAWHADRAGIASPTVGLMSQLSLFLKSKALYAQAEPLIRRALAIDEQCKGPDHPDVAIRLNNLAQLFQATNRLAEAEPLMRRALAIDEKSYGPEHPSVARDLNNLASLLQATNRLAEAEPLMRRALAIDENSYEPEHPVVARDLNNLAQLLQATNRLAEAEPLMRRALAIDENSYGPEHPEVATDLNNLAQLLQATDRLAEADPLMRRALAIDESSYGPEHPEVATDLNNLASLLQATNRPTEAEPLMRRALRIRYAFKRSTGYEHPNWAAALENYHYILHSLNLPDDEIDERLREFTA
ncbi:MAG TPA: tetratricopeptide repeat protein [Pirellulales bacterium]|nr:tetratricopeptide repeat protein [Pirellulales bacterium]